MVEQTQLDPAKEMPLAVAFIRVFSVLMFLIGVAEFIISGVQLDASNQEDIGGIYFAVTAVCSGVWGLVMVEGIQQFNVLSLLLFLNLIAAIIGVVYASIPIFIIERIKACAVFDPAGQDEPRCQATPSTYDNFTCTGNADYFIDAAQCGTKYQEDSTSVKNSCGCVYVDGGTHCKEFAGYEDCDEMQDTVAALSMGTYILGYMCLSLSFLLLVSSVSATCTYKKRRGVMGLTDEELRRGEYHNSNQGGGIGGFFASPSRAGGPRVTPAVPLQQMATMSTVHVQPSSPRHSSSHRSSSPRHSHSSSHSSHHSSRHPSPSSSPHRGHHKKVRSRGNSEDVPDLEARPPSPTTLGASPSSKRHKKRPSKTDKQGGENI